MAISASTSSAPSAPFANASTRRFTTGKVRSLAWNADGRRLATGGTDKTLRLWVPDKAEVSSVRWDPAHPELLASCSATSSDKGVYFWDIRQGKPTGVVQTSGQNIHMSWSPDGQTIVVSNRSDDVSYIDVRTQTVTKTFRSKLERNESVFSHDGKLLMTALDGFVQIARWPSEEELARVELSPVATIVLDLDPRARYLAAGSNDACVTLWDLKEWGCVASKGHHEDPIRTAKFSHDGQFIASSSGPAIPLRDKHEGKLIISEVPTLDAVQTMSVSDGGDVCAWHPSRLLLAYASGQTDDGKGDRWSGGFKVWGV